MQGNSAKLHKMQIFIAKTSGDPDSGKKIMLMSTFAEISYQLGEQWAPIMAAFPHTET